MERSLERRAQSEDSLEAVVSGGTPTPSIPTPKEVARQNLPQLPRASPPSRAARRERGRTQALPEQKERAEKSAARESPHVAAMFQEPTPEAPVPFGAYELIRRIGAGGMG